jgi:hypothetical protein
MDMDERIREFGSGDPIAGTAALSDLVALGDSGEEALFAQPIRLPTVQVKRRWLRYIASRPNSTGPRLLERLRHVGVFQDMYEAADLFAGLPVAHPIRKSVGDDLAAEFKGWPRLSFAEDYWRVAALLYAWASVGGSSDYLWQLVSDDSYAWEKIGTHAFRATCQAAARNGTNHLGTLESFVTSEWRDGKPREIDRETSEASGQLVADDGELWLQSFYTFPLWRSGNLVDGVLKRWSQHGHWRVRAFGAQILEGIGFRHAVPSVVEWLRREKVPAVRSKLIGALASSNTTAGADALLAIVASGESQALWRASDRSAAILLLEKMAEGEGTNASEALVSLARLGVRSRSLEQAIVSSDSYRRLNGALAVGLLGDKARMDELLRMLEETSGFLEQWRSRCSATLAAPRICTGASSRWLRTRTPERGETSSE